MIKLNEKISDFISSSKLLINNSINDPVVKTAVALYGYNEARLTEAQNLVTTVEDLHNIQAKEYGDQYHAQDNFQTKRKQVHENYMDLITIAKIAFKNDVGALQSLGLNQVRKKSYSGWLSQALQFCNNLLSSPSYITGMEEFGQNTEKIESVKSEINETLNLSEKHKSEKGEAQQATQKRDEKLDELHVWTNDYKKIVRIALKGSPQLIEKLGLLERS